MSWRCIPARAHVTHRQLRSRGLRRSSNVSWRSVQLPLRAESRVPGPEAILSYVHRDPTLKDASVRLPCSQTTIWKILRSAGCIQQDRRRKPKPLSRRQPGEEVQFDLKDASSVPADPEGKRQHVVEIANFVDAGTSIWLHRQVGADFDAETRHGGRGPVFPRAWPPCSVHL